jgi:V/A-type H+-transporting ATPase subunit E
MTEQLQGLLDRIQTDGVEKAEAEASRIVEAAKQQATDIVRNAEADAARRLKQAEQDGEAFAARGKIALQQAARDVVISVGEALSRTVRSLTATAVRDALKPDAVGGLIAEVVTAYIKSPGGERRLEVLVPEAQQQAIHQAVMGLLADALRTGVTIKGDGRIVSGFRVRAAGDSMEHDFTDAAITDAICQLVRPHIAQIVRDAAS